MTKDPGPNGSTMTANTAEAPRKTILEVDVARFQHALQIADASEAEKAEYLQLLWEIVVQFVDMDYGVHPVQQCCGQLHEGDAQAAIAASDAVHWREQPSTKETERTASQCAVESEES
ncbi:MAG: hypothetical protein AAFR79_06755 [Pseudomonadota bacterium]